MKTKFKKGDKFILEIGNRQLDEYEIAGTDYYIKISLLEKLTPYESYEPEEEWISCEDDLPKKPSVVYCYCRDPKLGGRWTEMLYYNHGLWCKPDGLAFAYEVLAWYPLPKQPYKEKRMMTLDEAIIHCEEVADYDCYNEEQMKCANEHRQLAEWLKEYKELKSLQTAKKPKWKAEDRFVTNRFQQFPYCPHCGYEITTGDCYCHVCGQHIDWEEYDA